MTKTKKTAMMCCRKMMNHGGEVVKHKQDVLVKCPYYKGEEKQMIFCEGVQDGSKLHLAFNSDTERRKYKGRFCKAGYNQCLLAKMLNGKWDYDGK